MTLGASVTVPPPVNALLTRCKGRVQLCRQLSDVDEWWVTSQFDKQTTFDTLV